MEIISTWTTAIVGSFGIVAVVRTVVETFRSTLIYVCMFQYIYEQCMSVGTKLQLTHQGKWSCLNCPEHIQLDNSIQMILLYCCSSESRYSNRLDIHPHLPYSVLYVAIQVIVDKVCNELNYTMAGRVV